MSNLYDILNTVNVALKDGDGFDLEELDKAVAELHLKLTEPKWAIEDEALREECEKLIVQWAASRYWQKKATPPKSAADKQDDKQIFSRVNKYGSETEECLNGHPIAGHPNGRRCININCEYTAVNFLPTNAPDSPQASETSEQDNAPKVDCVNAVHPADCPGTYLMCALRPEPTQPQSYSVEEILVKLAKEIEQNEREHKKPIFASNATVVNLHPYTQQLNLLLEQTRNEALNDAKTAIDKLNVPDPYGRQCWYAVDKLIPHHYTAALTPEKE